MRTKYWSKNLKGRDHSEAIMCRWNSNIRIYLREIGWEGVDWMQLAQDRDQWWALVNMVMRLQVAYEFVGLTFSSLPSSAHAQQPEPTHPRHWLAFDLCCFISGYCIYR